MLSSSRSLKDASLQHWHFYIQRDNRIISILCVLFLICLVPCFWTPYHEYPANAFTHSAFMFPLTPGEHVQHAMSNLRSGRMLLYSPLNIAGTLPPMLTCCHMAHKAAKHVRFDCHFFSSGSQAFFLFCFVFCFHLRQNPKLKKNEQTVRV